jgi:hypothetical protein
MVSAEPRFTNIIQNTLQYEYLWYVSRTEVRKHNTNTQYEYLWYASRTEVREHNTNTLQYEYLWYVSRTEVREHNKILYNMDIYGMSAEPRFANIIQILMVLMVVSISDDLTFV